MTVLELNELVKALEEEFGVSAAAAVAVAAPADGGAAVVSDKILFQKKRRDLSCSICLRASRYRFPFL